MEKTLPANAEAERAVLGSILLNHAAFEDVRPLLRPDDFYEEKHARIYAAMLACAAAGPVDIQTVYEELRKCEHLDSAAGIVYLGELSDAVPTSARAAHYARIVAQAAQRRRLLIIGGQIVSLAYDEAGDVAATLEAARSLLDGLTGVDDPRYGAFTAADLDALEIAPLRWAVEGILPQGLTLLIGKPKMRKSWLALALALAVALGGRALGQIPVEQGDVLYMALEDGKRRLQARQRKILAGASAPRRLSYLTAAPRLDAGCISVVERWLKAHPGARLVIIDVLAKVRPVASGRGSMYDEDYSALEPLQQLAIRYDIAILVVHHMNRSGAEDVFDLVNGSNGIAGSADGVLALQYERGQSDATLHVGGRDIEDDSALALHWDGATAQWVLMGKADEVRASQQRQDIVKVIREEKRPLGPREVADALGRPTEYQNIKQLMYRMSREHELHSTGGKYTLPSLTLIATDSDSGDPVIRGDPGWITAFPGNGTQQNGNGDRGDPNQYSKKLDHHDHRITAGPSEATESQKGGDLGQITADHLFGAPKPEPLDLDWNYVRALYAAGNLSAIRSHCALRRQDYAQVIKALTPEDTL